MFTVSAEPPHPPTVRVQWMWNVPKISVTTGCDGLVSFCWRYRPVPIFWFFFQWCARQKWNFEGDTHIPHYVATIERHIITNIHSHTILFCSTWNFAEFSCLSLRLQDRSSFFWRWIPWRNKLRCEFSNYFEMVHLSSCEVEIPNSIWPYELRIMFSEHIVNCF